MLRGLYGWMAIVCLWTKLKRKNKAVREIELLKIFDLINIKIICTILIVIKKDINEFYLFFVGRITINCNEQARTVYTFAPILRRTA